MLQNWFEAVLKFSMINFTFLAANMIKGKTPEEIRRTFNIENDFSPEEEEQIRKENVW